MTKAEIIAKIETEIMKAIEQTNERNQKLMEENGCSDWEIDFMKKWNDELVRPSVQRVVQVLGHNLVAGPETKQ